MKNLGRVTIVGVGALGSHVAQFLRNEVKLKVIDFDRVDQKNVSSQFHGKDSVRKSKTASLKATMQFLWGVSVEAIPHKLAADNVAQLLSSSDLVIDCLDNGASRRLVQRYCKLMTIPCLHGAVSAEGQFGRVMWSDMFIVDDEQVEGQPTCEGGEHLPFTTLVASYVSLAVQEFLHNQRQVNFHVYAGGAKRV